VEGWFRKAKKWNIRGYRSSGEKVSHCFRKKHGGERPRGKRISTRMIPKPLSRKDSIGGRSHRGGRGGELTGTKEISSSANTRVHLQNRGKSKQLENSKHIDTKRGKRTPTRKGDSAPHLAVGCVTSVLSKTGIYFNKSPGKPNKAVPQKWRNTKGGRKSEDLCGGSSSKGGGDKSSNQEGRNYANLNRPNLTARGSS